MDPKANQVMVVVVERAPSPPTALCRICHDEEEESSSTMEAPCACSGTLKFAHRRCVQRWCDEKGSTLCEVCLKNFEPNYMVAPKKALIDMGVTIRQSVEVSILEGYGPRNPSISSALLDADDEPSEECSPSSRRNASFFHAIALALTLLLLLRDLIPMLGIAADSYAFGILMVLLLRLIGILLPLFVVVKIAHVVQKLRRRELRLPLPEDAEDRDDDIPLQGDPQRTEHRIQIHS